jgi:hypothetical protein
MEYYHQRVILLVLFSLLFSLHALRAAHNMSLEVLAVG